MHNYLLRNVVFVCCCVFLPGCFNTDKTGSENNSPGFSIKGISLVAPVKPIDENVLDQIINLNANSIAIMPYAFFNSDNPVIKYNQNGQWWGESDRGVIGCIELAHKNNLSVMLKPHLWVRGVYTGAFTLPSEKEWELWENSYRDYILHFATIADSLKVQLFCIGTELGASIKERPAFWNTLIDSVKSTFHGKLTYAANWDDYKHVPFWNKLDYIGVDAYFPLLNDKTPGVKRLEKKWKKYTDELKKISERHNRPVIFTEYGYRNVDYNAKEPWKENDDNQNDKAQANAYEALYESLAGKRWFSGGYIWKWYADTGPEGLLWRRHRRRKIDFTPQGKEALITIEKYYKK